MTNLDDRVGQYVGLFLLGYLFGSGRWNLLGTHVARIGGSLGRLAVDRARHDLRELPFSGEALSSAR